MTPTSYRAEIEAVARGAVTVVRRPFVDSLHQAQTATRELEALAGRVREQREQQRWLATAGGLGIVGGVLLWFLLTRLLPWGAGDRLAGLPIGGGPWQAGQTLMRRNSPESFDKMVRLYKACPQNTTTELCEAAMIVRTIPPGQTLPEGARAAPPVPASHGRAGR